MVLIYFPMGNLQMLIAKKDYHLFWGDRYTTAIGKHMVQKGYARALSGEWLMGLSVCGPLGLPASSLPFSGPSEKSGWDRSSVSSRLSVGSCGSNTAVVKTSE